MLNLVFFKISLITNKSDSDIKKLDKQIKHIMRSNLQDVIIDDIVWEQTESVLPLKEDEDV